MAITEQERVAALLAGDEDAVAEARRWIRGAARPHRRHLAEHLEDLEQEVLLELLENLRAGRFEARSKLSTYVRRMMHYRCLNRARGLRRRAARSIATPVDDLPLADAGRTPEERAKSRSVVELALRVVANLPEECRRLWDAILAGRSYQDMAAEWKIAAGTLRVRALRCRQKAEAERERLEAATSSPSNADRPSVTESS